MAFPAGQDRKAAGAEPAALFAQGVQTIP